MGCLGSKEKEVNTGPPPPIGANDAPPKTVDPRLPFETYRQLFQMKNSWKAVSRALDATAKEAFVQFFKAHPEHQALHKRVAGLTTREEMMESTPFEDHCMDYINILDEGMECIGKDKVDAAIAAFKSAGKLHGKTEGFTESYYTDMEHHFLKAVELTLGDRYNDAVDRNFRRLYEFWKSQMIEGLNDGTSNRI